ncbi:MAG TPA: esterase-like activity of phytase family protein, partial [Verrucomicrobiae bacterium]|nr:esterase-like activity of phytase family protein [Verrucomicrobiae bacterium]
MKLTPFLSQAKRRLAGLTLNACALAAMLFARSVAAAVYDVDLASPQFTLYRDPNTGNEIKYGGFSGLFPMPGVPNGLMFYTITDRGPNGDNPTNSSGKVFPRPDFSPSILKLLLHSQGAQGGKANILEIIPLRKPNGTPVNGLPNPCLTASEIGYDIFLNLLTSPAPGGDPDGLDVEGITMDDQGNFWICEEYQPSICKVAPDGTVQFRLVPKGAKLCGTEAIPTYDILPPMLFKRRPNRGFEGVAAQNGKVYGILQRPLMNPTRATSDASRLIRLVEIDLATGAIRQLLYVTEPSVSQANVLLSDLFSLGAGRFLIPERRTDKLFSIDISAATDITPLEDANGKLLTPLISGTNTFTTIEQLKPADLATIGVLPVAKTVVLSSMIALDPTLEKIEGVAVAGRVLALISDNDF